jgi:hypothetical protein
MSDLHQRSPEDDGAESVQTSKEIARSLGVVWQDFAGQRPRSIEVEVGRDRIECVIDERPPAAQDGVDADDADHAGLSPHSAGYGYRASAAVARITHRRVVGFIPKRDTENEVSTQVFVLRRELRRY